MSNRLLAHFLFLSAFWGTALSAMLLGVPEAFAGQANSTSAVTPAERWPGLTRGQLKRHLAVLQANPLYDDPELAAYVQRVGEKVLAASAHADRPYQFLLLDDPVPNAFTQGTHYIYVNRGLLMLLNSEAQLAGVLAHEIGHNIGRHVARRRNKLVGGNILANTASILTGNSSVGQAINVQNIANLQSFGREMELEADGYASKYLYKTQYEPQEFLLALSGLADYQSLHLGDASVPVYHGLFSSHPRTDKRLRRIIDDAGQLPPGEGYIGRDAYRQVLDDMVYGRNVRPNAPPGYQRYLNEKLAVTFLYPDNWSMEVDGAIISIKDPKNELQLRINIEKTQDRKKSSLELLKAKYPKGLKKAQSLDASGSRDLGAVAKLPAQRVGLINVARNTFHFQGFARDRKLTKAEDQVLTGMIANFRRLTPEDRQITEVLKIYYERVQPGETFASMAKGMPSSKGNPEAELRVINGYYPKGEAEPGTWIKKLRKEKVKQ